MIFFFFFSSRRRHTRWPRDWSSDVCSSDLACGGILISDNVLKDGEILESRYAVKRRNRTIHARMREYLYMLTHHKFLETTILTIGDGVSLSVKNENQK